MRSDRAGHLEGIASTIQDFRSGEIEQRTPKHVAAWIDQFDEQERDAILAATAHALNLFYLSEEKIRKFWRCMIEMPDVSDADAREIWRRTNFLRIQRRGASQSGSLALLSNLLEDQYGLRVEDCGGGPRYLYVDDVVATGSHVWGDLTDWIHSADSPDEADVEVWALCGYEDAVRYCEWRVGKESGLAGKCIRISGWRFRSSGALANEDGVGVETHVLWPRCVPVGDPYTDQLIDEMMRMEKPFQLRRGPTPDGGPLFLGEASRHALEQAFLAAGCRIRYELCPQLKENHWPLGFESVRSPHFNGFGFGSLIVTYRNCPNNCPLALWAGEPWTPLFPRRSNPKHLNRVPRLLLDDPGF